MPDNNKLFDDMARVFNNTLGTMAGMKGEIETLIRQQFSFLLKDMDLVTREEFEVVKEMASKARSEQEKLEKKMVELEKAFNTKGTTND